ncbi:MAG: hypothetical protein DRQ49_08875 [Gammaproteobacteria bacterium]|nr:MAG: hypothetical protein DRQ49_08875 [Gammaproteobacteria bacterium]RKZ45413.1 MAG: hypothetical protein DRQ41_00280 [Gammaproteobacteria bacterium]RKZ74005.1 MAG: hypothetical protein DRQ57_12545 [Gammaproteobacteria bacterium]
MLQIRNPNTCQV